MAITVFRRLVIAGQNPKIRFLQRRKKKTTLIYNKEYIKVLASGGGVAGVSRESVSRKLVFRIQNNNHQNTRPGKKKKKKTSFDKSWVGNKTWVHRVLSAPVLTR